MFRKTSLVVALFGAMAMGGCGSVEQQDETGEIVANLVQAGFPRSDIQIFDGRVFVGLDAHVTLQASREMLEAPRTTAEQYRTTNLVSLTVKKICLNPTSALSSNTKMSQGLDLAIANYNNLGLNFVLARGPGQSGCNANITVQTTSGGAGGSSGFPSGGLPYGIINLSTANANYSLDVNEHVTTHEIGHTIGFRHSDYYNRAISCGTGGNEGASTVGAILIPGTPSTAVVGGSVMNSCFRSTENGEWTSSDITALNYLY